MIGENIHKIRNTRGLTLSELAERANISKSYLSSIERNLNKNPSIHIVEKIALVLNVDFKVLMGSKSMDDQIAEEEWVEFVKDLKASGIVTDDLHEYKSVIEFAKWHKKQCDKK